jgi:hypothetical protein
VATALRRVRKAALVSADIASLRRNRLSIQPIWRLGYLTTGRTWSLVATASRRVRKAALMSAAALATYHITRPWKNSAIHITNCPNWAIHR